MSFFINSDFMLRNFRFSSSSSVLFCGTKLKNHLPTEVISDFSETTNLDFVLYYQKITITILPEFSPILLFRTEYPLSPNPIMYSMNQISYLWRLNISFSCWAPVTKSLSFNTLKLSWWRSGIWAWAYRKDHEVLKLREGLRITEAGVRLSKGID